MPTYTATDGTIFDDRNAWRKYEFETNYTVKDKTGISVMKIPGDISGQPFDLADNSNCEIMLLDHTDQVQVDQLTNCRVFIASASESVFIRNCTDCVFTVACKQLRTRDCEKCDFYLYSQTDPIIETSNAMRFAPFNGAYNGLRSHFEAARLDPTNNHWARVYDFNDPDKSGSHWSVMTPEQESPPWIISLEETIPGIETSLGLPENPVDRNAQATLYDDSGNVTGTDGMQSFSFDTTQEQAQVAVQSHQPEVVGPPDSPNPFENGDGMLPPSPAPTPISPFAAQEDSQDVAQSMVLPPASPMTIPEVPDVPETWPKLEEVNEALVQRIQQIQLKENALVKQVKKNAETDMDTYYGERTDRLAHRAATNREQEEEKLKLQALLKEKAEEQPWVRVVDLIDTSSKPRSKLSATSSGTKQPKTNNSESEDNVVSTAEGSDISRMRSTLVQLKNSGGLEIKKAF